MKKIKLIYRLLCFIFCVFILLCFSSFISFFIKNKIKRQKKISKLIQFLSQKLVKVIDAKIKVEGLEHLQKNQNYLIVANHVSYVDIIFIHSFIHNNRFITHYEIQENNAFLNLVNKKSGSYYVERRNLKNIRKELRETAEILKKGLHLVFFPEGTSTDGSRILDFHPPFFVSAINAKKSILPVCINYKKINNKLVTSENRDFVCWYNQKTSFTAHLLRFLQLKSIEVKIKFLSPINSEGKNSRTLAIESRERIQKYFIPYGPSQ